MLQKMLIDYIFNIMYTSNTLTGRVFADYSVKTLVQSNIDESLSDIEISEKVYKIFKYILETI